MKIINYENRKKLIDIIVYLSGSQYPQILAHLLMRHFKNLLSRLKIPGSGIARNRVIFCLILLGHTASSLYQYFF